MTRAEATVKLSASGATGYRAEVGGGTSTFSALRASTLVRLSSSGVIPGGRGVRSGAGAEVRRESTHSEHGEWMTRKQVRGYEERTEGGRRKCVNPAVTPPEVTLPTK